jgi:ribonucleoside-diphosphate reductase alpha chain
MFAEEIFKGKYSQGKYTWPELAKVLVDDVCGTMGGTREPLLSAELRREIEEDITAMRFIPGGRYLYYAGRPFHAWNNCYLFRGEEDTREEWGRVLHRNTDALMTGGGTGNDYSVFRAKDTVLKRTGGLASGPLPLAHAVNEVGRNVKQGGDRRSAIYGCLDHRHADAPQWLVAKNWHDMPAGNSGLTIADLKKQDFNFPAPFDCTNISLNYDLGGNTNAGDIEHYLQENPMFLQNVFQALSTGEPGFSFNWANPRETLRNACTEVTSEDDSDVCNLGSVNLSRIKDVLEMQQVVERGSMFLVCGTLRADLPNEKIRKVREKNRRLGLGLMGIHEWLLQRGARYEVTEGLHHWLQVYKHYSETAANRLCNALSISRPVAYRAIAPTGTIGNLAGTTTGIEPLFAVAYKRRYRLNGRMHYQYVIDGTADLLIKQYGAKPADIESALDLAADPERRIQFQADVQDYVDMSISSTINLPEWGTPLNNPDSVRPFAEILARYAHRLRGFTCYPDGARGGQPLTSVPYTTALKHKDAVYEETDICEYTGKGGTCGK